MTRALRALSSAYVQRRGLAISRSLDTAGNVRRLHCSTRPCTCSRPISSSGRSAPKRPTEIHPRHGLWDRGCGCRLGLGGRRQTPRHGHRPSPVGSREARRTYRELRVTGRARAGDLVRLPPLAPGTAVVAAYVLNELPTATRELLEARLPRRRRSRREDFYPSSQSPAASLHGGKPWRSASLAAGGRADEWRSLVDLPPSLRVFDKAAGLDHRELTARSLYCPGAGA